MKIIVLMWGPLLVGLVVLYNVIDAEWIKCNLIVVNSTIRLELRVALELVADRPITTSP